MNVLRRTLNYFLTITITSIFIYVIVESLEAIHKTSLSFFVLSFSFCSVCFSIDHTLKAKGYNRNIMFGNKCTDVLKCLEGINSIHFWQMNFNILATKKFSNEIVLTFTFTFNFVFPFEYCLYQILYLQHFTELWFSFIVRKTDK